MPILPDFMVFLNWKELPWYWHGFDSFCVRHADGAAGARRCWPSSSAGSPSARRVTGVYLSIITQALTYALHARCSSATTWASAATTA
jgi:urea transport system permease protein